jgi:anthranilate phosphoribosyltransferase
VEGVLAGAERGPRRDVVLLNAAAAFLVAGRAEDLTAGVALAAEVIDTGAARALLARLRAEKAAADAAPAATTEVPA